MWHYKCQRYQKIRASIKTKKTLMVSLSYKASTSNKKHNALLLKEKIGKILKQIQNLGLEAKHLNTIHFRNLTVEMIQTKKWSFILKISLSLRALSEFLPTFLLPFYVMKGPINSKKLAHSEQAPKILTFRQHFDWDIGIFSVFEG